MDTQDLTMKKGSLSLAVAKEFRTLYEQEIAHFLDDLDSSSAARLVELISKYALLEIKQSEGGALVHSARQYCLNRWADIYIKEDPEFFGQQLLEIQTTLSGARFVHILHPRHLEKDFLRTCFIPQEGREDHRVLFGYYLMQLCAIVDEPEAIKLALKETLINLLTESIPHSVIFRLDLAIRADFTLP
jgi:hypothetical protein